MAESPVQIGEVLAGKYRVEQILGQGGMGVVVGAWHLELEQRVAVKFLLPEYAENPEAAERFRREARAAVKIQSEHVARVVDVGTMNAGVPYMVMEFLDGRDLGTELEQVGRFAVEDAVDCVFQTCLAIAEAHSKGVIHRDLKPSNLFLTSHADGSRLIKVLDFGISKSLHTHSTPQLSLTRTSVMIGSPLYMSPEQLESSKEADERSDVWSIGVILFELLTGSVPFTGDTLPQLVRAVLTGQHRPISDLAPEVPEALSAVVERCLDTNKNTRMRNVAELADALAPFTADGHRYSQRVRKVFARSQTAGQAEKMPPVAAMPQTARTNTGGGTQVSATTDPAAAASAHFDSIPVVEAGPESEFEDLPAATRVSEREGNESTVNSWGRTRGNSSVRPGRARWGILAALTVALLGGGGAVLWTQQDASSEANVNAAGMGMPASPEQAPAADSATAANGAAANGAAANESSGNPAAQAPSVEAESDPAPDAQPTSALVDPAPAPATAEAAAASAAQSAEPTVAPISGTPISEGNTGAASPPRPERKPARPAVKPKPTPSPASKPDPFTDFGGRR